MRILTDAQVVELALEPLDARVVGFPPEFTRALVWIEGGWHETNAITCGSNLIPHWNGYGGTLKASDHPYWHKLPHNIMES